MLRKRIEKKIGAILIEAKAITEEQLEDAIDKQKLNGDCLGKNLVDLGYIDEDTMARHIAVRFKIPYLSLDRYEISKDLLNVIPQNIARSHGLIPLDLIGDILTIGIVNTVNETTLRRLEKLTGYKIRMMVVTAGDFYRNIQKIYNLSVIYGDNESGKADTRSFIKMPSYRGKERRRYQRFNKELRIKYELNDEYSINTSLNISQGGLLIRSKSPVPVDAHIVARIELPTSHEDVIIISRVARVEKMEKEDIYLIAINFSSMDATDGNRLSEYISFIKNPS